jgi:hypothetical protein
MGRLHALPCQQGFEGPVGTAERGQRKTKFRSAAAPERQQHSSVYITYFTSVILTPPGASVNLSPFWVDFSFNTTPLPFFMVAVDPPATKVATAVPAK